MVLIVFELLSDGSCKDCDEKKQPALDETVKEEEGVKSSLCNLKLRNLNRLIFCQININSIRNKFELLFYLVSNNIDVLLISETKIDNTFPVSQFCVPGYSVPFRLDRQKTEEVLCYMLRNIYLVEC